MKQDFDDDVARRVWQTKYSQSEPGHAGDATLQATWRRVAAALAQAEGTAGSDWEHHFHAALENHRFLPGGRILAGAGSPRHVTLFNCFVMGAVEDSLDGIFNALKEGAVTMQQGGGVGYDFSTLRPRGMPAHGCGTTASGPVSFMHIWDSMCATILSAGARRGAMMGTLRCDHPDIEEFTEVKRDGTRLRNFNLSVLVTDAFMEAVETGEDWPLVFPLGAEAASGVEVLHRVWPGHPDPQPCRVLRRIPARALWERIMRAAYDSAEPGVIFIDTLQRANNLRYCEYIQATNPCGEIPLPAYGACDLGSINLTRFVHGPFTQAAKLDLAGVRATAAVAVRMLDNVHDVSRFPLPAQAAAARAARRIGLGITGLADALIMLGVPYGSDRALEIAGEAMAASCHTAYRTSIALAREKGAFPQFCAEKYLEGEFIRSLPRDIVDRIGEEGIRNSHLTAIAPTGTISLLAHNVSSGIEPVYALQTQRHIRRDDGGFDTVRVVDYAYRLFRELNGPTAPLPGAFVTAADVPPEQQLAMQATLQRYVDNAISKTVNVPQNFPFEAFRSLYRQAHRLGLKGCTAFRPNAISGAVIEEAAATDGCVRCAV